MNELVISHMDARVLERVENYAHDPQELRAALADYMRGFGIIPLEHSVAVLEYLVRHRTNPTAEEVFKGLQPAIASLTRIYVNATIEVLANLGTIKVVNVETFEAHYSVDPKPHAHLICSRCGNVEDMPLSDKVQQMISVPHGAAINDIQVMCLGLCSKCNRKEKVN